MVPLLCCFKGSPRCDKDIKLMSLRTCGLQKLSVCSALGLLGQDSSGGGIYLGGSGTTLTNITDCYMAGNAAELDGGALCLDGGVTVLANNTFQRNYATARGGAVAYTNQCFATEGTLIL